MESVAAELNRTRRRDRARLSVDEMDNGMFRRVSELSRTKTGDTVAIVGEEKYGKSLWLRMTAEGVQESVYFDSPGIKGSRMSVWI